MKKPVYRIKEFCEIFSIPRSTLYVEIAAGKLKIVKRGRSTYIRHKDAERWLNAMPKKMCRKSQRPTVQPRRAQAKKAGFFASLFNLFIVTGK